MFYAGLNSPDGIEQIGLAVSDDLVSWTRTSDKPIIPVGSAGDADALQTSNPCVIHENGVFRMWYQGRGKDGRLSVCYAESVDCLSWTARTGAVLSAQEEVNGYRAGFQQPHVIFDSAENQYRMWFVKQNEASSSIWHATSIDGVLWNITGEVLAPSVLWEGSLLYYPFVRRTDGGYELWYTARTSGKRWSVGMASSTDGLVWERVPQNPILPISHKPFWFRRLAQYARINLFSFLRAAYGSGSPNIVSVHGTEYLFTHDSGAGYRLSVTQYERSGKVWKPVAFGVLEKSHAAWDAYFQADPFILEVK